MQTENGQCRSLPLLYLILAEELGIDAWLALAPNHSYIRIKDQQGKLYNLELTRGKFVSDGFIMGSGYINAAALQSNIYMDTLGREQLFDYLLNDLNFGYHQKFGFRLWSTELAEHILERDPRNVSAIMTKGNHLLHLMKAEARELGYANAGSYLASKRGKWLHALWQEQKDKLVRLGYQEMPEEAYIKWLQSLEEEVAKQQRQVKFSGFQDR